MKDNYIVIKTSNPNVVNCFQKLLSSWWRTTVIANATERHTLWIAFKNYYLRDEGQQHYKHNFWFACCELLSKIIIFVMKDNVNRLKYSVAEVVNCFQKLLSSWWRTTFLWIESRGKRLWIAFKNYYLRDEGQQHQQQSWSLSRCELLSKIIIFVMKDNYIFRFIEMPVVVNCFQKLLSSWWRTTMGQMVDLAAKLWIAFKNYYLRDEGQPSYSLHSLQMGCELLSKIIIFVMKDNLPNHSQT